MKAAYSILPRYSLGEESPWTVSPDAADHIAAIRRLIDRGATHVMVHSPQHDHPQGYGALR